MAAITLWKEAARVAVDRVAPHVYARRLDQVLGALAAAKAAIQEAEAFTLECIEAGQHAAAAGAEPQQGWMDELEVRLERTGLWLVVIARGGKRR